MASFEIEQKILDFSILIQNQKMTSSLLKIVHIDNPKPKYRKVSILSNYDTHGDLFLFLHSFFNETFFW